MQVSHLQFISPPTNMLIVFLVEDPIALQTMLDAGQLGYSQSHLAEFSGVANEFAAGLPVGFEQADGVRAAAAGLSELVAGDDQTKAAALKRLAEALGSTPSALYAAGLAELRNSGEKRRAIRPVGNTAMPSQDRVVIESEHSITRYMEVVGQRYIDDRVVWERFHAEYGYHPATSEQSRKLADIWSSEQTPREDRIVALSLWRLNLIKQAHELTLLNRVSEAEAARIVANGEKTAAYKLLSIAADSGVDDEMRELAFGGLCRLLSYRENEWAVSFLDEVRKALDEDFVRCACDLQGFTPMSDSQRKQLISLYGGVLVVHSSPVKDNAEAKAKALVNGTLALFDIARLSIFSADDKGRLFRFGIYAAEKFVPDGARIVYDWVDWMVRTEKDPHVAFTLAYAYSDVLGIRNYSSDRTLPPAIRQQIEIALMALQRGDLSAEDKKALWKRLKAGQSPLAWFVLEWLRHFGSAKNPSRQPVRRNS